MVRILVGRSARHLVAVGALGFTGALAGSTAAGLPGALPPMAPRGAAPSVQEECLQAYSDAQRLRKDGRLVAAREQLVRCAQDDCPQVTRTDCVPWLRDVERATPTVVIVAKDRRGHDTARVRVTIDGEVVAQRLDGRAIAVDPGAHRLLFEHGDEPAVEQQVVIQESVKDRQIQVSFEGLDPASPTPGLVAPGTSGAPPSGADEPTEGSAVAVAGWVLTGFGVAGLGLFAALGIVGRGEIDDYQATCAPTKTCDEDEVASTRSKLLAADVSLGIGLAALSAGLVLVIYDAASGDEPEASPAAAFALRPIAGGALGHAAVRF